MTESKWYILFESGCGKYIGFNEETNQIFFTSNREQAWGMGKLFIGDFIEDNNLHDCRETIEVEEIVNDSTVSKAR